jgi:hypothetical protein
MGEAAAAAGGAMEGGAGMAGGAGMGAASTGLGASGMAALPEVAAGSQGLLTAYTQGIPAVSPAYSQGLPSSMNATQGSTGGLSGMMDTFKAGQKMDTSQILSNMMKEGGKQQPVKLPQFGGPQNLNQGLASQGFESNGGGGSGISPAGLQLLGKLSAALGLGGAGAGLPSGVEGPLAPANTFRTSGELQPS